MFVDIICIFLYNKFIHFFDKKGDDFLSVYTLKEQNEEISMCTFNHFGSSTHSHNFLELVYIEEGKAVHILNGEETTVKKGNYLIIDYGANHKYQSVGDETVKIINCLFLPSFLDKSLKNCRRFSEVMGNYLIKIDPSMLTQNPSQTVFEDFDGKIYEIIKNMLDEYNVKNKGFAEVMRANLIEIIVRTMRQIMDTDKDYSQDSVTGCMKEYVQKHFSEQISLTDISKQLNYSLSYLSIKFKKDTGMNFNDYVQRYRVEQSCTMLKNSNKKIYDIAKAVGYRDLKYFNGIFKKIIGMTPYRFRKL